MKSKNLLFAILFVLVGWQVESQNLVMDPSFEIGSPVWQGLLPVDGKS